MACLKEEIHVGEALVAMIGAAAAATGTAETVIIAAGFVTAFIAASAVYIEACYDLGDCLSKAGRPDDAAKIRQQADELQREIDQLKQRLNM
jgi:hypothetical protein